MLKARLKFKAPWDSILVEVARQCGMTVDQYCERAVMLVTKQGIEGGSDGSRSQESSVVDGQVSSSQAVNSTAVVIEEDTSSTEG